MTINGHFSIYLYIFVWIYHGCLTNTVYAMDPNNSVIKRLWCIWEHGNLWVVRATDGIIAPGEEANGDNLGKSFLSSI